MSASVFALSWNICIDKDEPSAPENFAVSGNVVLSWSEATDSPESTSDCTFGIDHYNVYVDGNLIGSSEDLSYSGNSLSDGSYIFEVSAVDRAGNEGDRAIKEVVFPISEDSSDSESSSSGGGSGGSSGGDSSSGGSVVNLSSGNESTDLGENEDVEDAEGNGFSSADFENEKSSGFFSFITGGVIGAGAGSWFWVLFFVLLVFSFFIIVKKRRKEAAAVVSVKAKKKVVKKGKKRVVKKK